MQWLRSWLTPRAIPGIALGFIGVFLLGIAASKVLILSGAYDYPIPDALVLSGEYNSEELGLIVVPVLTATQVSPQDQPRIAVLSSTLYLPSISTHETLRVSEVTSETTAPLALQDQTPNDSHTSVLFTPPIPTRITISTIKVDSPVVEVGWKTTSVRGKLQSVWEVADYAVGYHRDSVAPGQRGNTVLSGHNNTKGEVFRNLALLHIGDSISVFVGDREYRYVVKQKLLLDDQGTAPEKQQLNYRWIEPTADERLTLVSCWPYSSNTKRLIIVALPQ
jgi:sortase A